MKLPTLLFLAALASSSRAGADGTAKTEARIHIDKASQLHKDGKYQQALDELTVAYSLDPQPALLYAIGQVHVKLGQCKLAIAFYERFLGTRPEEGAAGAAQEAIATCKRIGEGVVAPDSTTTPPAAPPPAPPPPVPASPPAAPPDAPADTAWYRDAIGDALVGGGTVVLVMGAVVYASAIGKLDDADAAKTYAAQQDLVDKAHTDRLFSVLLVASGAALVAGGIYHYVRYTDAATGPQIGLVPTKGGAFASFAMRF